MRCRKQTRRSLLLKTLAAGTFLVVGRFAAAQEDQPGSSDRPKKGDLLVISEDERAPATSSSPMI
jgi:rieske iron-sulfur protein